MPKSLEGQRVDILTPTRQKWSRLIEDIRLGKRTRGFFPYPQLALIVGVSIEKLKELKGRSLGMEFSNSGAWLDFSSHLSFTREAYRQGSMLVKLSLGGRPEVYWRKFRKARGDLVAQLQEVPGFSDLVTSVMSGVTPEQDSEAIAEHVLLSSWYNALLPGEKEGLIRPQDIFTQPG